MLHHLRPEGIPCNRRPVTPHWATANYSVPHQQLTDSEDALVCFAVGFRHGAFIPRNAMVARFLRDCYIPWNPRRFLHPSRTINLLVAGTEWQKLVGRQGTARLVRDNQD